MVHDHQRPAACTERMYLAAQARERGLGREQVLRGDAPHGDDQRRRHELDLPLEVAAALQRLLRLRVAIARRPALEHVGDVDVLALEAERFQHRGEQLPGAADERLTLAVLIGTRGLADEHPAGLRIADAEHRLGAGLVQRAARALGHQRTQRLPPEPGLDAGARHRRHLKRVCSGRQRRRRQCCVSGRTPHVDVHAERGKVRELATVGHLQTASGRGARPSSARWPP